MNKESFEKILKSIARADTSFKNLKLADLSGERDFSGVKFHFCKMRGTELDNMKFTGADFEHADLRGADLSRSDLSEADLDSAELDRSGIKRKNVVLTTGKKNGAS